MISCLLKHLSWLGVTNGRPLCFCLMKDAEIERGKVGGKKGIDRGLEKGRKMRVSERRNGGVKNRKRGERENGRKIERVG